MVTVNSFSTPKTSCRIPTESTGAVLEGISTDMSERFVVFASESDDLVDLDSNSYTDIFRGDGRGGIALVSLLYGKRDLLLKAKGQHHYFIADDDTTYLKSRGAGYHNQATGFDVVTATVEG